MLYCRDCRFFQPNHHYTEENKLRFGHCGNEAAAEAPTHDRFLSPAFDRPGENKFASLMRDFGGCGHDAKLFEPREPESVAA